MTYIDYMDECIKLAKKGHGETSPNPMVGCIVLDKNGNKISEGYHAKYGENHAERNALLKLKGAEARGGTLIVNLEPCSHYGKNPPCADLIIEHKIARVVIGVCDPNPIVAGKGIKKLREAGIEVIENVREAECKKLNEVFLKNQNENKTFISIKTATTLDGKIATCSGSSKWITSEKARNEVKNIRNCYDAIMTSSATVITDNPTMEHKIKIILDRELKTDMNSKIYQQGRIIIFHDENKNPLNKNHIEFIATPTKNSKFDLDFVFKKLYEIAIMSVLIESGGILNGEALKYTDKIYHFIAPKITGDNSSKSCFDYRKIQDINNSIDFKIDRMDIFEPDMLLTYYPI